jgi:hypothetical protein
LLYAVQNLVCSRLRYKIREIKIYKIIILPVVLYGCKVWPLRLREEYTLMVFEKRVLRGLLGSKREEVTGEWKKNA